MSRLVLSPIVTRPAAQQQQHIVSWGGWSRSLCSHSNSSWGWVGQWQYLTLSKVHNFALSVVSRLVVSPIITLSYTITTKGFTSSGAGGGSDRLWSLPTCWSTVVEEDASKARISFRNLNLQIFKWKMKVKVYGNYHVPVFCQERSSSWPPHDQQESAVIETTLNICSSQLSTWTR